MAVLKDVGSALFGDDAEQEYNNVNVPTASSQTYTPGTQIADTAAAQGVSTNALDSAKGDAGAQSAQRQALAQIQARANGGLNASDKAALYGVQQSQAAQNRGEQGRILQGAAERGSGNSGASLAAQLSGEQSAAQNGADQGVAVAGQAADRATQASKDAGSLAGSIEGQQFGEQSTRAGAANDLAQFNANSANQAALANMAAKNNASQFNVNNAANAAQFNDQLQQQQYENQMGLAGAKGNASTLLGQLGLQGGQAVAQGIGSLASAGGKAVNKAHGGTIQGKASVPGDSLKNDTVPAMLSPGEVVIPRSHVGTPDKMIDFLEKATGKCFDDVLKSRGARLQAKTKKTKK